VIIGASITIGFGLFLGGSAVGKNYSAISAIIPALLGGFCWYGVGSTSDPMSQHGLVTYEAWVFLLVFSLGSTFGLPLVIAHALGMGATAMGLYIGGALVILVGFVAAHLLSRDPSADAW
jgi:uncharacterized membrane protein SpoIIM required for sporulation